MGFTIVSKDLDESLSSITSTCSGSKLAHVGSGRLHPYSSDPLARKKIFPQRKTTSSDRIVPLNLIWSHYLWILSEASIALIILCLSFQESLAWMIFQNSLNNVENSQIIAKKLLRPVSLVVYFPDPVFLTHLLAWELVAITISLYYLGYAKLLIIGEPM